MGKFLAFFCSVIRIFQALYNFMLKSSVEILGKNNARRLLKSAQIMKFQSIISINTSMPDYFINSLVSLSKENHILNRY